MLSRTAAYAIRACRELARRRDEGPVTVAEIGDALDVPRNYLAKILHKLGRAGIVESTRGPGGGFQLLRPPDRILLSEIVGRFQPDLVRIEGRCLLGPDRERDEGPCPVHAWWVEASGGIHTFFCETTLSDLTASGPAGRPAEPRAR